MSFGRVVDLDTGQMDFLLYGNGVGMARTEASSGFVAPDYLVFGLDGGAWSTEPNEWSSTGPNYFSRGVKLGDVIADTAARAATEAVRRVHSGEFQTLGAVEDFVGQALQSTISSYGPAIAQQLSAVLEPAAKKAIDVIKPSIDQALKDYTPVFASIVGVMIGMSVIAGVWIAKREMKRARA